MNNLESSTISTLKQSLIKREISSEEITKAYLYKIEQTNEEINSFITVDKEVAIKTAKECDRKIKNGEEIGLLEGIPVAIKDNIAVKDMKMTCGSQLLKDYIAPYDATIIRKFKNEGAIIIGKTNTDEFAIGSSTETSYFGITKNPIDKERIPGGSSGGSAASVASNQVPFAIGSSTGGSVRHPASYCGVVGFKPTYGIISRYGLMDYASTLDHIGILTKDVEDVSIILNSLVGYDKLDSTSIDIGKIDYTQIFREDIEKQVKGMRVGLPREYFDNNIDIRIKKKVLDIVENLEKLGVKVQEVSLPYTKYVAQTYQIISSVEASSDLAKLDGIRYGTRAKEYESVEDLIIKTRSQGFGAQVKKKILQGNYFLSGNNYIEYYKRAKSLRRLITTELSDIFKRVDVLISPTTISVAPKINADNDIDINKYETDKLTIPANLAGTPAITIKCGDVENLPVGMQIMGDKFKDRDVLKLAYMCQKVFQEDNKCIKH